MTTPKFLGKPVCTEINEFDSNNGYKVYSAVIKQDVEVHKEYEQSNVQSMLGISFNNKYTHKRVAFINVNKEMTIETLNENLAKSDINIYFTESNSPIILPYQEDYVHGLTPEDRDIFFNKQVVRDSNTGTPVLYKGELRYRVSRLESASNKEMAKDIYIEKVIQNVNTPTNN